jgi:hypothetical protein
MGILKKLKDNLLGTEEQNKEAAESISRYKASKDREQVKKMRKPDMDEQWELDYYRKGAATPVDENASVLDAKNNRAKTERALSRKNFDALPQEIRDYDAYKNAGFKKGGKVKAKASGYKAGGSVKARGCGIATKGLTKGRMV